MSDLLLYLVLKPCGEDSDSANGAVSLRDQVNYIKLNHVYSILKNIFFQDDQRFSGHGETTTVNEVSKDDLLQYSSGTEDVLTSNIHSCVIKTENILSHDTT